MSNKTAQFANIYCAREAVKLLEDYPDGMTARGLIGALIDRKVKWSWCILPRGLTNELSNLEDAGGGVHSAFVNRCTVWRHDKYKAEEEQTND